MPIRTYSRMVAGYVVLATFFISGAVYLARVDHAHAHKQGHRGMMERVGELEEVMALQREETSRLQKEVNRLKAERQ